MQKSAGLVILLVACTDTRAAVDAGTDPGVDSGGSSVVTCETDFMCTNGDCTCLSGSTSGDECCHPDDCPGSELACDRVCEACIGRPDGGRRIDAGTEDDAGSPPDPPEGCDTSTSACHWECISSGDSTYSCEST